MKRIYAEQINNLLEAFYFSAIFEGRDRTLAFTVLSNGIQHLHGVAFCAGDTAAADELKPFVLQVLDGEIPQPLCVEAI